MIKDIDYNKYLKYKNKYLQLKTYLEQTGGAKLIIKNINIINQFTDPNMEQYLNPIYGLYMCESGEVENLFLLYNKFYSKSETKKNRYSFINLPDILSDTMINACRINITRISTFIPPSIRVTSNISKLDPLIIGQYIALFYIIKTFDINIILDNNSKIINNLDNRERIFNFMFYLDIT